MKFENSLDFAQTLDRLDPLSDYKDAFYFPEKNGERVAYFTGNSLGLQPKQTSDYVEEVMESWRERAVEGHFEGNRPWWDYHERLATPMARIVGALPEEVSIMNTLTVNLHLLLVSFYRPEGKRYKILCEEKAFPSDQYALRSQLRFHGYKPSDALIEVPRSAGTQAWSTRDILEAIAVHKEELALVFFGGVNYYNGQVLDMQSIARTAGENGIPIGFDLAHAAGNVPLQLHDWGVDFATWCSYKYLNSGPGNASAIFVHQRHLGKKDIPRFEGWWGQKKETRFLMEPEFDPIPTADAWQLSNAPILSLAPFLSSLDLFERVGMEAIWEKQAKLVGYLEFVLGEIEKEVGGEFEVITPAERGCQLTVLLHGENKSLFHYLIDNGVIVDWREPSAIRVAPVPLYNSFEDIYTFGQKLKAGIQGLRSGRLRVKNPGQRTS